MTFGEWTPAVVSGVGMLGFLVQGAGYWVGIRLGWTDPDDAVGPLGCTWTLTCASLIVAGFLLQRAPQR